MMTNIALRYLRPVANEPGGAGLLHADVDVPGDGLVGAVLAVDLLRLHLAPVRTLTDARAATLVTLVKIQSNSAIGTSVL